MSARQSLATILSMIAISAASVLSLATFAQSEPRVGAQRLSITAPLNLDAARAAQVDAILQAAQQKRVAMMDALRVETDAQLATVLTADELAKLQQAMPPHGPDGGARKRGTPM
jgi:hypothetical protein